ncbi:MAG: Type 4 prepilin-like protein leader peptide-processing enzyme [candidate division TM6 bacterium GW2011_GWF2_37_49]|nr:MAG: Type 4 prepilin-like protein leader peptide-processing enzyme [candidate division TM6 bacterium GW2011_GWF2_37_49]
MEISIIVIAIFLFGLVWGSFLNVVAHRFALGKPFFTNRSKCPVCEHVIFWYDNIPLLSWLLLMGKCRNCKNRILFLYPAIELISGLIFVCVFFKLLPYFSPFHYFISTDQLMVDSMNFSSVIPDQVFLRGLCMLGAFFIFFSALIAATRSDLEAMVIPQLFSLWLVPLGFLFAYFNIISISIKASLIGAFIGYFSLWFVALIFKLVTKRDGMGVGDMELLALIGSFLGPLGVWFSLLIGSLSGLLIGTLYLIIFRKEMTTRLPFGPFLALGATFYFLFDKDFIRFFFS